MVQSGASGGKCRVSAVDTGGIVTTLVPVQAQSGTGYSEAATLDTTGGTGTGLKVDITDVGESPLVALQNCRAVNFMWYTCLATAAVAADHKEIAAWIQAAQPSSVYFYTTADADALTGVAGNVFSYLKDRNYNRVLGQYSTSDYAVSAIMGYAMGQNTGLANSAYTLKFKQEVGIDTEDLTTDQIGIIEGNNGNLYISYGNYYSIFEQGKMANGQFFDEIINLDMLVNDIQLNVMDLLYQTPKVPQTDPGVTQLMHVCNEACETAVLIGFLAPGQWTGQTVLNLNHEDMLPKGYLTQALPIAQQSDADRQARKSPPIYIAIKEAGAIHSVLIGVYVNR